MESAPGKKFRQNDCGWWGCDVRMGQSGLVGQPPGEKRRRGETCVVGRLNYTHIEQDENGCVGVKHIFSSAKEPL